MEQTNSLNPVVKAVETATKPGDIKLDSKLFYHNGSYLGMTPDLIQEPFGNSAGYSAIHLSMGFDRHSSQPTFEKMMQFSINPTIIDGYVYIRTANVLRAFPLGDAAKYGIPLVLEDLEFEGWKAATEEPTGGGIEYVRLPEFQGFIVSSHEIPAEHEPYKFVTYMEMDGHNNRIGEMLSRSETLRQDALKHFNSKEGYQLMQENLEDGEEIENLGVTSVDGILYGIGRRVSDGKLVLFTGINTYGKLAPEADAFNLTLEDMINVKLAEEAKHRYRGSYDRDLSTLESIISEERATKQDLLAFYIRFMRESESDPKSYDKYSKIVRSLINDIATIGRYIDIYTTSREDIERMDTQIMVLMADAYANGYKTEADVMAYVDGQLKTQSAKGENGKDAKAVKSAKGGKGKDTKYQKGEEGDSEEDNNYERNELDSGEATEQKSPKSEGDGAEAGGESSGSSE